MDKTTETVDISKKDSFSYRQASYEAYKFHNNANTPILIEHLKSLVQKDFGVTEVPNQFVEENKGIILFVPTEIQSACPTEVRLSFYSHNLHELRVLSINDLERVLQWCDSERTDQEDKKDLCNDLRWEAVDTFLRNLELYRLTKNPRALIHRYGRLNEDNLPMESRERYGSWILGAPDLVQGVGQYRVISHWFRKDSNYATYNHSGSTVHHVKTIGEAKKDHFIALDPGEDSALVLIKK